MKYVITIMIFSYSRNENTVHTEELFAMLEKARRTEREELPYLNTDSIAAIREMDLWYEELTAKIRNTPPEHAVRLLLITEGADGHIEEIRYESRSPETAYRRS